MLFAVCTLTETNDCFLATIWGQFFVFGKSPPDDIATTHSNNNNNNSNNFQLWNEECELMNRFSGQIRLTSLRPDVGKKNWNIIRSRHKLRHRGPKCFVLATWMTYGQLDPIAFRGWRFSRPLSTRQSEISPGLRNSTNPNLKLSGKSDWTSYNCLPRRNTP